MSIAGVVFDQGRVVEQEAPSTGLERRAYVVIEGHGNDDRERISAALVDQILLAQRR